MYGRQECRQLVAALLDRGGVVLIQGALGMGKTTMLDYAASVARDATVLRCRGYLGEADIEYSALHDLLKPVLTTWPDRGDRLAVCLATLDALTREADSRPVLCLVDDAHLMDRLSLDAIVFAARRLRAARVTMLIATCDGTPIDGLDRIQLSGLDERSAQALACELGIPEPRRTRLIELSQGNPRVLADLARCDGEPLRLPASSEMREAYQAQLDRMGDGTRWLLLLAAADDDPTATGLTAAAQLSNVDLAALIPAERMGLLRVDGDRVEFPLPMMRELVYELAPLADRRRAHLHLAHTSDPERQRLRRAVHLAAAACGPDPVLAQELEAAAASAGYSRASQALERAAQLTADPAGAAHRLVAAARFAWLAGSPHRARSLLETAMPEADRDVEGRCELLVDEIEVRSGAAASTLDPLLATADRLADSNRALAVYALTRAAEAVSFCGDYSSFETIADRAERLRRVDDPPRTELAFEYISGFAALMRGSHAPAAKSLTRVVELAGLADEAGSLTLASAASLLLAEDRAAHRCAGRAVEIARAVNELSTLPIALEMLACAEYWMGHHAAATATSWEGLAVARSSGQDNYANDHLGMLALLAALRGDRQTCLEWIRELAVPPGAGQMNRPRALCRWALAVLDVIGGRPADAVARLAPIADHHTGEGQPIVLVMATPWLVEAAARGQDRDAAEGALTVFEFWATNTGDPLRRALAARCRAVLAPRGCGQAAEHFEQALVFHTGAENDFERARTELLFGQELRRSRRPRDAREHLHAAVEIFQQMGMQAWGAQARAELRAAGESGDPPLPSQAQTLTPQQLHIARLVTEGATNREVAAQLFLSPRTVDHHMRNIFTKLGIRSRIELAKVLSGVPAMVPDQAGETK